MNDQPEVPPEQRLYEAVARWEGAPGARSADLVLAACHALIDGVDSPALRELAGASARDSVHDLRELVDQTLDELRIRRPGSLPPGQMMASGGTMIPRPGLNSIRFEVAELTDHPGGFQVLVFVDGVEVTARGAGLGMDPNDVFVPRNRLVATEEPRQVPIARCTCGVYGCGMTDVVIVRDGDRVCWEWLEEKPMERGVTFPAAEYDAEVERLGGAFGWETPERTAARLVLAGLDRDLDRLGGYGLTPDWASTDYRDPSVFRVAFRIGEDYQVFVRFAWKKRTPQKLAAVVARTLTQHPRLWPATWHAIRREVAGPPPIAGRDWRRDHW